MRRHRSSEENITERGQEMQDNEDLAAGRLERESMPPHNEASNSAASLVEELLLQKETQQASTPELAAKQRRLLAMLRQDAMPEAQGPSTPTASADLEIDAPATWLQDRAARADAPETEEAGIRAEALRREQVGRMASVPRDRAAEVPALPAVPADPDESFLDSNLRLFSDRRKSDTPD